MGRRRVPAPRPIPAVAALAGRGTQVSPDVAGRPAWAAGVRRSRAVTEPGLPALGRGEEHGRTSW